MITQTVIPLTLDHRCDSTLLAPFLSSPLASLSPTSTTTSFVPDPPESHIWLSCTSRLAKDASKGTSYCCAMTVLPMQMARTFGMSSPLAKHPASPSTSPSPLCSCSPLGPSSPARPRRQAAVPYLRPLAPNTHTAAAAMCTRSLLLVPGSKCRRRIARTRCVARTVLTPAAAVSMFGRKMDGVPKPRRPSTRFPLRTKTMLLTCATPSTLVSRLRQSTI
ncbi:hypothetical protein C8F01DRAFT_1141142 [Mycena amicta]|nr:hypothetical protein C8F01DRAFT_1141142 [Mycena amicta]